MEARAGPECIGLAGSVPEVDEAAVSVEEDMVRDRHGNVRREAIAIVRGVEPGPARFDEVITRPMAFACEAGQRENSESDCRRQQ